MGEVRAAGQRVHFFGGLVFLGQCRQRASPLFLFEVAKATRLFSHGPVQRFQWHHGAAKLVASVGVFAFPVLIAEVSLGWTCFGD
jgi:hypothetical protein